MSKHTPEPWSVVDVFGTLPYVVSHDPKEVVAERVFRGDDAKHIVACVNACKGLIPASVPHLLSLLHAEVSWLHHAAHNCDDDLAARELEDHARELLDAINFAPEESQ